MNGWMIIERHTYSLTNTNTQTHTNVTFAKKPEKWPNKSFPNFIALSRSWYRYMTAPLLGCAVSSSRLEPPEQGAARGPQGCHSQPLPSHSCIKQIPFPGISHNFFLTFYWYLLKMWLICILSKLSSNMNLYLNTTGSWLYASQADQLAYCFPVIFWR